MTPGTDPAQVHTSVCTSPDSPFDLGIRTVEGISPGHDKPPFAYVVAFRCGCYCLAIPDQHGTFDPAAGGFRCQPHVDAERLVGP